MHRRYSLVGAGLTLLFVLSIAAQTNPPRALSPTARLQNAQTAFLKNAGGSEVPFNVISEGVQGWGRYQIVNAPEKADIIVEVTSPATGSGVSVSSTSSTDQQTGMPSQSAITTRELQVARITLIVYDAKSKMALWSASEQPKGGLRDKTRQDNIVATAQHLVSRFRERVDPDSTK